MSNPRDGPETWSTKAQCNLRVVRAGMTMATASLETGNKGFASRVLTLASPLIPRTKTTIFFLIFSILDS